MQSMDFSCKYENSYVFGIIMFLVKECDLLHLPMSQDEWYLYISKRIPNDSNYEKIYM